MEIQPLCRYHFRNASKPKEEFLILDLLPQESGAYDQYTLEYVGSVCKTKCCWIMDTLENLHSGSFQGSFEEVKSELQTIISKAFVEGFKCDVSYLAKYFA